MRQKREKQRPLSPPWPDHQLAHELKVISRILDDNPQTLELIVQDLSDRVDSSVGAPGLTAEQVLRCAVIKQLHQFSYRKLEFHLVDSQSCQRFCRLPYGASISKATLAENLGKIEPGTWKAINDHLVRWAQARGLEKGQRIRVDATAVQTNVHYPLDSELLDDGIRVVTRWLGRLRDWEGIGFVDHTRRAKRRGLNIRNRRGKKRLDSYRDLIKVASKTAHYGEQALAVSAQWSDPLSLAGAAQLAHYLELLHKVIEQTQRRVLSGEAVAAQDKICSLFEEHTDIIKKSPRETVFGHKVFVSTGASSLILDCVVERGNPADSNYVQPFLERHRQLYGKVPRQSAWDGGFASAANLSWAKEQGVQDVAFSKKCGLTVESMVRSSWVYKQLKRFRAGIEGCIGTLKHTFGLHRCTWKGWPHFQSYVHASVLTYNLVVLARLLL